MSTSTYIQTIQQHTLHIEQISQIGRKLHEAEVQVLKQNGNTAASWDHVFVTWKKTKGKIFCSQISNCNFLGQVCLGTLSDLKLSVEKRGINGLQPCLKNSTFNNVFINDNVVVMNCNLISNTVIGERSILVGCGTITCLGSTQFANDMQLDVVVEVGGRTVPCYAEMHLDEAIVIATNRNNQQVQNEYSEKVNSYADHTKSICSIVDEGVTLLNVPLLLDSYVGKYAFIEDSTIQKSTILSNKDEQSEVTGGSCVTNSILQWNVHISSQSIVERSVLLTSSHVERHGKVFESIIGSFSGVAEGEVTSSLVGPFVGFHHQALLIACFWPSGKGNIGYGANVGSNHTGKAPDQELWAGEGVFFGLGSCIKFPSNFINAVYSIVATGVVTLPQRVEFPFSLISSPQASIENIGPAINQIHPGWVLSQNIYTVLRNREKFLTRGSVSKRLVVQHEILRYDIVLLLMKGRKLLLDIPIVKQYYTSKDIPGLGKNFMTESARKEAIETYTYFIQYYAVRGLWRKIETKSLGESLSDIKQYDLTKIAHVNKFNSGIVKHENIKQQNKFNEELNWSLQRNILGTEKDLDTMSLQNLLKLYVSMELEIAIQALKSKEKDNVRGKKIIDDYIAAHGNPKDVDKVVIKAHKDAVEIRNNVDRYLRSRSKM